jgi:hypothetical protein
VAPVQPPATGPGDGAAARSWRVHQRPAGDAVTTHAPTRMQPPSSSRPVAARRVGWSAVGRRWPELPWAAPADQSPPASSRPRCLGTLAAPACRPAPSPGPWAGRCWGWRRYRWVAPGAAAGSRPRTAPPPRPGLPLGWWWWRLRPPVWVWIAALGATGGGAVAVAVDRRRLRGQRAGPAASRGSAPARQRAVGPWRSACQQAGPRCQHRRPVVRAVCQARQRSTDG